MKHPRAPTGALKLIHRCIDQQMCMHTPSFHRSGLLKISCDAETPCAVACQEFKLGASGGNDEAVH